MDSDLIINIREATSRTAGVIIRAIEMAYGKEEPFDLIRRSVLSALGEQGLAGELSRLLNALQTQEAGGNR